MRDFTINEAADEAALNFPGIDRDAVRHICNSAINNILSIIEKKEGRIRLQHGEIHTIYFEVVPKEQRAAFADLDESRELTKQEEEQSILERQNANKAIPGRNKRVIRHPKRIHYERFDSDAVYPK